MLFEKPIFFTLNESIGHHVFKDENGEINRKCPKCDDGELYLENSKSENILLDDNKIKKSSYNSD